MDLEQNFSAWLTLILMASIFILILAAFYFLCTTRASEQALWAVTIAISLHGLLNADL
jgi:hypothetical protein